MAGADHFSGVARAYAAHRPTYPAALFEYISSLTRHHDRAWDCGAGSGQATEGLRSRYARVVATDISRSQLASAPVRGRVDQVAAAAERSPLAARSVDLVAVAQALHWIDLPSFYGEVRRVIVPGGAIVSGATTSRCWASPRSTGRSGNSTMGRWVATGLRSGDWSRPATAPSRSRSRKRSLPNSPWWRTGPSMTFLDTLEPGPR
jgi:SAM-dependent methyltransferase